MFRSIRTIVNALVCLLLTVTWLVCLRKTDAFYSVYLLVALLSLFALTCNLRHKTKEAPPIRKFHTIVIALVFAVLSLAVLLANYELVQNAAHEYLIALLLAISGFVVWMQMIFAVSSLPIKRKDLIFENMRSASRPALVFCVSFS